MLMGNALVHTIHAYISGIEILTLNMYYNYKLMRYERISDL